MFLSVQMCYNLHMCKRTQFSREGTDSLLADAFEENYVSETSTEKPEVSKWRSRDVVFEECE